MTGSSPKTLCKNGFTLVEILVTFAVVGILLALSVYSYNLYLTKGRDSRRKADLVYIQNGLEQYKAQDINGSYPNTNYTGLCTALVPTYVAKLPWDPQSTDFCSGGAPTNHPNYTYNKVCNANGVCSGYTLTAILETGALTTYSINQNGAVTIGP